MGGIVLQNLSKEIRECYENAERCGACARQAVNSEIKNDYLEMEKRWLSLAPSYEFAERLSAFIDPIERQRRRNRDLSHPRRALADAP